MVTTSWEVTGVLVEGGVPFGERYEPTSLFKRAIGAKIWPKRSSSLIFQYFLSEGAGLVKPLTIAD